MIDVSYLLGKGVGLMDMTTEEGHISTLVASAILRDHSADPYAYQPTAGHCFPRHGATLTYLLLQAHADPNIIPPKTKPTTMLELAVELGSSQHVGRGMGSPIPCVQQGEVDPRGSGGTLNWA